MTNPIARVRTTWSLAIAVAAIAALLPASAQEAGMRVGGAAAAPPPVISPAVAAGRVTFRLRAPDARAVTVSGDFGPDAALSRGGALQAAGIKHTFVESPGAHHWRIWRGYLGDVAPLLFR